MVDDNSSGLILRWARDRWELFKEHFLVSHTNSIKKLCWHKWYITMNNVYWVFLFMACPFYFILATEIIIWPQFFLLLLKKVVNSYIKSRINKNLSKQNNTNSELKILLIKIQKVKKLHLKVRNKTNVNWQEGISPQIARKSYDTRSGVK